MSPATIDLFQTMLIDAQRSLAIYALCIVRFMATFIVLPITGPQIMPMLGRTALAISLASIIYPSVLTAYPEDGFTAMVMATIVAKEIFIGFTIGYLASIIFWAAESIGHFVDTHRGATLAGAMFQNFGEQSSPLGGFLLQLTIVVFLMAGGLRLFLEGYYQSFIAWPVLSYFPQINAGAMDFFIEQFSLLVYIAVVLAAPMVIAMFLVEFSLALMNRFVPQLQVFFLAMPVKSVVAFFILILYLKYLLIYLQEEMGRIEPYYRILLELFS